MILENDVNFHIFNQVISSIVTTVSDVVIFIDYNSFDSCAFWFDDWPLKKEDQMPFAFT